MALCGAIAGGLKAGDLYTHCFNGTCLDADRGYAVADAFVDAKVSRQHLQVLRSMLLAIVCADMGGR